jgi:RND family efflux transporter MFP subunit
MVWIIATLAGCGSGSPAEVPADPGPATLSSDDVAEVYQRAIATGPRISGSLEAGEKAVLRAEASGSVEEIRVELGDKVAKDALLARIDNQAVSGQVDATVSGLAAAEQDVAVADRELERTRTLADAGALSARDVDMAEANAKASQARLLAAKAEVAGAREQLDGIVVRSPIAGIVSARSINVGDVVAPGAPLFTVIEPSSLRLEGSVPAESIGTLTTGTPVWFEVQGFPGRTFEGTVDRIAPAVDPATRQIPILVSIPNQDSVLVAGLFADGRVASSRHEGLVVPVDAVERTGTAPSVLRIRDGVVERVPVDLGVADDAAQEVEIVSGLVAADQVIIGAARDVEPGRQVRIEAATADAER